MRSYCIVFCSSCEHLWVLEVFVHSTNYSSGRNKVPVVAVSIYCKRSRKMDAECTVYKWSKLEGWLENGQWMHKKWTMSLWRTNDQCTQINNDEHTQRTHTHTMNALKMSNNEHTHNMYDEQTQNGHPKTLNGSVEYKSHFSVLL